MGLERCFQWGDDLSQTSKWASGQNHCAVVGNDLMWYSVPCSSKTNVYCSQGAVIQYYNVMLSWNEAVKYCMEYNSQLATVTQLNSAHIDKVGWIGLYRVGGGIIWNWTGSLPSSYRNWAPGQPLTADCGSFDAFAEEWVGYPCSEQFQFLCCWEPSHNAVFLLHSPLFTLFIHHSASIHPSIHPSSC
uniref:C-type lectin domain-containing protein n=1 Tax=Amphilophus citrinellus TaxID=61819 RepID=A0A3Q0SV52_AMPCI